MNKKSALIISIDKFCENNIKMRLEERHIADTALPGQFVNILCSSDNNLVLRRPISIMDANPEKGYFDIAFEIRGEGTKLLSKFKTGMKVNVMGPLGNGFEISESYKNIAIVGGGIGIYPLYFLARKYSLINIDIFMGYQCAEKVVLGDEFEREGCKLYLSTDDGSRGHKGYIPELFENNNELGKYDITFICGPEIMSRKIVETVRKYKGKCQVSIEERMGCGIGACLVCTCEIEKDGVKSRARVCKDGPVFDGNIVFLEGENE